MLETKKEGRYGFPVALSTVVGIVIGIGIFFKAKPVLEAAGGNPKLAIIAWILGGIIAIVSGLTAAEVGAAIPESGGMIAWIRKLYGHKMGYLVGWAQAFIYTPGLVAVLAYYFVLFAFEYLKIVPTGATEEELNKSKYWLETLQYLVAMGATTFIYIVNIYTKKCGGYIQTVTTIIKILPLVAIIIFGMASKNNPTPMIMSQEVLAKTSGNAISLIGLALVPIMFTFDGWILIGTIAGDIKNVEKNLPKAIIIGIGFIAFCYATLNIAILRVYPATDLIIQGGLSSVAIKLFGNGAAQFILLGITISAFGALNGNIMVSTRIPYSLALTGNFPKSKYFSVLDKKNEQPVRSSWLMYVVSISYLVIMLIMKDPDTLSNIPTSLFFFFYLLVFYGVFLLRRNYPEIERPYRVPFFPVLPILAIIGGLYILSSAIMSGPIYMLIGIIITLSGLIFYKK